MYQQPPVGLLERSELEYGIKNLCGTYIVGVGVLVLLLVFVGVILVIDGVGLLEDELLYDPHALV